MSDAHPWLKGDLVIAKAVLDDVDAHAREALRIDRLADIGGESVPQQPLAVSFHLSHRLGRRLRHCCIRCCLRFVGLEGATPLMTTIYRQSVKGRHVGGSPRNNPETVFTTARHLPETNRSHDLHWVW